MQRLEAVTKHEVRACSAMPYQHSLPNLTEKHRLTDGVGAGGWSAAGFLTALKALVGQL